MKLNQVYRATNDGYSLKGMHRVLWINEKDDWVTTIEVPDLRQIPRPEYFKKPVRRPLFALKAALNAGDLLPVEPYVLPMMLWSDEAISQGYSARRRKGRRDISAPIECRDSLVLALQPFLTAYTDRYAFFECDGMQNSINEVRDASTLGANQIYNAAHRFLALGVGFNGFIPFRDCCGGRGGERKQKKPLGNTSSAYKAGLSPSRGYALTREDKDHLAFGWAAFMDGTRDKKDAFALTNAMFWSEGQRRVDGETLPLLLTSDKRPSFKQFKSWGPRGVNNKQAYETFLTDQEWDDNYRARLSKELDRINAVGVVAVCDACWSDLHLVGGASRLTPIGSTVRLTIHEGLSSMVTGFYLGLDAPSENVALMAVLSSATSLVDLCRVYGIECEEDDFPAVFASKYLVDNGEFRTRRIIQLLPSLGSAIELTQVGRGSKKGSAEAAHRSLHKLGAHRMSGTTLGRQRKRGEDAPALHACWRFHEYVRMFLLSLRYYNCEQRVEKFFREHRYAVAMRKDGVPPIRKAIHQWCVRQGYVAGATSSVDRLRSALLTPMKAVVQATGIHLIRPDCGERSDVVMSHRFLGPRATELQWLERARRSGVFKIDVRVDPNHLQRIWYNDELGLHEFINQSNDIDLVERCTLHETLVMQDEDVENRTLDLQRSDQAHANLVVARTVANDQYQREKQAEIKGLPRKPTKKSLTSNILENREEEKARIKVGPAPTRSPRPVALPDVAEGESSTSDDWLTSVLEGHRDGQ